MQDKKVLMANPVIEHNTVINKIKDILEDVFTAEEIIRVYIDFVPENFLKPSFSVLEISLPGQDGMIQDDREFIDKTYMFDIMYYPKESDKAYTEYRNIENKLMKNLKSLKLSDTYEVERDRFVNSFVQDKVGHFIVSFPIRLVMHDTNRPPVLSGVNINTNIN